jgi:hypothetical protein
MSIDGSQSSLARATIMAFLEQNWARSGGEGPLPSFGDDDNLVELGLIDSLSLAELLVGLEDSSGHQIDFLTVDPDVFFTMRGMLDLVAPEAVASPAAHRHDEGTA